MNRTITQYFNNYAASEAQCITQSLVPQLKACKLSYHSCLCIPAFAEDEPLEHVWKNTLNDADIAQNLVILFGNWPKGASAEDKAITQASLTRLEAVHHDKIHDKKIQDEKSLSWVLLPGSPSLLLIQANEGLEQSKGVGLARKIAMDIAVGLFQQGLLQNPWVGTTDADAVLPFDYWEKLRAAYTPGLLVFPFQHQFHDNRVDAPEYQTLIFAHEIYQAYLSQYVDALQKAMPEFAFHTIGSIFAIHILSYAQVRGYPTLAAGEDFYLLNKLVKTACITQLEGNPILLRPRHSQRTPFGTGPSVGSLLAHEHIEKKPLFYDPQCLEMWSMSLKTLRQVDQSQTWSSLIPSALQQKLIQQYKQCRTSAQKQNVLISVMDGLRCQQLLRRIHENTPKISWQDFLASKMTLCDGSPSHTFSSFQPE